uniref:Secretory protein 30G12 n=1 Tax=Heterodera glycines TaxID=51029 RepID=A0A7D6HIB8_HETGL|nr:secretory protein 30G12 [Heterodera glycines]
MSNFIFVAFLTAAFFSSGLALPAPYDAESVVSSELNVPLLSADANVEAAITNESDAAAEIQAPSIPVPIEHQTAADITHPTETGNESSIASSSSTPKSEQTPKKVMNMKSALEGAAANVYGGLPLDKQPKTIAEAAAKAKQTPAKLPADYDVNRVAERAAARVYGWLPEDKQPKAIYDAAEKAKNTPKPPGDYDVERVAQKAARLVYGVLPIGMQPNFAGPSTDKSNVDDSEKPSAAAAGDDDDEVEKEKKE